MIIPNYNFISLLLVDQNNHVGFIHHLYESDISVQVLDLLFRSCASRIILQNFKTSSCSNSKVFLRLIGWNGVDFWLNFWCSNILFLLRLNMCFSKLIDSILINNSCVCFDDISLLFSNELVIELSHGRVVCGHVILAFFDALIWSHSWSFTFHI